MKKQSLLVVASAAALLLLSACSKSTADKYAKINSGMTRDEVHSILGSPDNSAGTSLGGLAMTTETWKGDGQTISINFFSDKVALKSLSAKEDKK